MDEDAGSEGAAELVDDGLNETTRQASVLKGRKYAECQELDTRTRRIKRLGGGEAGKPSR